MDSRQYNAVNSTRLLQGDSNSVDDSSSNIDIRIGQSFNERQDQIGALTSLIDTLKHESSLTADQRDTASRELSKVSDELRSEQQPSSGRIKRWLENARTAVDFAKLGVGAADVAKKVYESFGMGG
jgi:hypothetical protein